MNEMSIMPRCVDIKNAAHELWEIDVCNTSVFRMPFVFAFLVAILPAALLAHHVDTTPSKGSRANIFLLHTQTPNSCIELHITSECYALFL